MIKFTSCLILKPVIDVGMQITLFSCLNVTGANCCTDIYWDTSQSKISRPFLASIFFIFPVSLHMNIWFKDLKIWISFYSIEVLKCTFNWITGQTFSFFCPCFLW